MKTVVIGVTSREEANARVMNALKTGKQQGACRSFESTVESVRNNDVRTQSFAYVLDRIAVLTVVHVAGDRPHIISFRTASEEEREVYYEWLENDYTA